VDPRYSVADKEGVITPDMYCAEVYQLCSQGGSE